MKILELGKYGNGVILVAAVSLCGLPALAQYGGGTGGSAGGGGGNAGSSAATSSGVAFSNNYHLNFDRPESWSLKWFASASMLSGLTPGAPSENHHVGSINIGIETGWLPTLDAGQQQIGFNGHTPENLNQAPVFIRPVIRVGLPAKFTGIIAGPPPFTVFGVRPHLLAFGLERPILEQHNWMLGWRGYGQVGSVKGAFTCPQSVLSSAPGTPGNPARCTGVSSDVATLRYAGMEAEVSYRIPRAPMLVPHASVGGNFIDGAFQVNAPVVAGLDRTHEWTHGGTLSTTGGITFLLTQKAAFTVDMFYSPLWVQRTATSPRTNDGLFNVRALLSYTFR